MNNNDILRRLRYALDMPDKEVVRVFGLGGQAVTENQVKNFMRNEEDPGAKYCIDSMFSSFLDGLILDRRGPPPAGRPAPAAVEQLSNNDKLKKIRIALNLQEDAMLAILKAGGHPMSRGELSALFRKPNHKHYRACGDQVLRKFLSGLTKRLRPKSAPNPPEQSG